MPKPLVAVAALHVAVVVAGCGGNGVVSQKCEIPEGTTPAPDFIRTIGCQADFLALASEPLDATIPGARSGKVILDQQPTDNLYFQNSSKYKIHYQFASTHLSGPEHPIVKSLGEFNRTEYYSDERRFILGAVTHYEGPDIWALEVAPYDTASAAMIEKLFAAVKNAAFFGSKLVFHPTSEAVEAVARMLPASIPIKTTDDIFARTDYQPLNLGTAVGKLRFVTAANLATEYLGFRDIVVLDHVPNDISVVAGMITEEFQTPLSHVNVLAQNRHSPNMGLRGATVNAKLKALDGKWVELVVGASIWDVNEKTEAEANDWWDAHKPTPVQVPDMDLSQTELKDIQDLVDESTLPANKVGLGDAIKRAILAYGGKAANYSVLAKTEGVTVRKAFAIPVFYYDQFMRQNGFYDRVDALLGDPRFQNDAGVRDARLAELRADIEKAPVDPGFSALLKSKLEKDFAGMTMRFRTSTNAEDQEDFLCAGCYDSHTGDPTDWDVDRPGCNPTSNKGCSVLQAIRKAWSGVWYFRTFEERSYNSIDQKKIGMALLVHHNFSVEQANGVAVTANIFDSSGLEPAFYVNVQTGGDAEVVAPPPGISSDELLYFYAYDGMPITYLGHSNLLPAGKTVLTAEQVFELGTTLDAIQKRFSPRTDPSRATTAFTPLRSISSSPTKTTRNPGNRPGYSSNRRGTTAGAACSPRTVSQPGFPTLKKITPQAPSAFRGRPKAILARLVQWLQGDPMTKKMLRSRQLVALFVSVAGFQGCATARGDGQNRGAGGFGAPHAAARVDGHAVRSGDQAGTVGGTVPGGTSLAGTGLAGKIYYVSPTGRATNDGASFATGLDFATALDRIAPGESILMQGGTYTIRFQAGVSNTITLSKVGTADNPLKIFAEPGKIAVIDFSCPDNTFVDKSVGFMLSGSYWTMKGIAVTRSPYQGVYVTGAHNTFENCAFYANRNTGLEINKGGSYTTVINCDAYRNYDPKKLGSMADGFGPKQTQGPGNKFINCRAWENSDDGFDCYDSPESVTFEGCWAFRNGIDVWNTGGFSGNGNGFKVGGNAKQANHVLTNCIAFENRVKGFDQNNNSGGLTIYNCLSARNGTNYGLGNPVNVGQAHVLKNNIALGPPGTIANATQTNNSWSAGFPVSESDFLSVDSTLGKGTRNPDGTLPRTNLFRLKPGSKLIDAGVDVGLPFGGGAPDMGPFETTP